MAMEVSAATSRVSRAATCSVVKPETCEVVSACICSVVKATICAVVIEAIEQGMELAARKKYGASSFEARQADLTLAKAQQALYVAQAEERDNSPMMIAPNISMYTR